MHPVQFTEYVGVPHDTPKDSEELVVSYCDLEAVNRCKEEVRFGPGLAPTGFRSSVICYNDCTKKRFINRVEYEPKMKPQRFSTTCFVRPRHLVRTCATFVDVPSENNAHRKRWFRATVKLEPKTYSSCKVQGLLEFDKTVEEKNVDSDGTVKIHVENYKNGELINVNDVIGNHVMNGDVIENGFDDAESNPRIREVLETLKSTGPGQLKQQRKQQQQQQRKQQQQRQNRALSSSSEDLVWMDGYIDKDNNIVPVRSRSQSRPRSRTEQSPDYCYQADDEDNEEMMISDDEYDDEQIITNHYQHQYHHHLKKRKYRKAYAEFNNNNHRIMNYNTEAGCEAGCDDGVRYRSGPFIYNVPKRRSRMSKQNGGKWEEHDAEEIDYSQLNGF